MRIDPRVWIEGRIVDSLKFVYRLRLQQPVFIKRRPMTLRTVPCNKYLSFLQPEYLLVFRNIVSCGNSERYQKRRDNIL